MQKIITLIIFFALNCSFAQSASEYSAGASSAYKAGNFTQAKEYFELALAQKGNATLNYNLANTCEKLGEFGAAKAYYMRAIYLKPRFKEAIFNLDALEKKYALSNINSSRADIFFDELSQNEWLVIASISIWLTIILAIALLLFKRRNPWLFFLGLISFSIFTLSAFGVSYWYSYANTVVALKDNAPLKISPTKDSIIASTLKEGQMLNIKKEKAGFCLLENSSKKGWAKLDDKNFIRIKN